MNFRSMNALKLILLACLSILHAQAQTSDLAGVKLSLERYQGPATCSIVTAT